MSGLISSCVTVQTIRNAVTDWTHNQGVPKAGPRSVLRKLIEPHDVIVTCSVPRISRSLFSLWRTFCGDKDDTKTLRAFLRPLHIFFSRQKIIFPFFRGINLKPYPAENNSHHVLSKIISGNVESNSSRLGELMHEGAKSVASHTISLPLYSAWLVAKGERGAISWQMIVDPLRVIDERRLVFV